MLSKENDELKAELAKERSGHSRAVQQYVTEVAARSRLQAQLTDERAAKEHAIFMQGNADKRNTALQVW